MRTSRLLLCVVALAGCDSFKPASLVEGLRVLGIRADPPEVASGEHTTLHPLVADLRPAGDLGAAPLDYEWTLCTRRPKVGVDIDEECFDADLGADVLLPLPTLADGGTELTMPMLTLMSFGLPDSSGGFYVPVRLRLTSGDQQITAFHRLRWNAGFQTANQNPTLSGIAFVPTGPDGELPDLGQTVDVQALPQDAPFEVPAGAKIRLRASAAPGSAESYETVVGDPRELKTMTVTEQIRFFWYASVGKLDPDVNGEERPDVVLDPSEYPEILAASGGLIDVWVVAREERGGLDFMHRQLRIR